MGSSVLSITDVVPQGSVLGPLLFSIYISDRNHVVDNLRVNHFADDSKKVFSNSSLKFISKYTNHELKWLQANRISLNVNKTEITLFRPKNKTICKNILYITNIIENSLLLYIWVTSQIWLQIWGQHINYNLNNVANIQHKAIQIFNFKNKYTPLEPLFKETKIMKLNKIMKPRNCLLPLHHINQCLPFKSKKFTDKLK